MGRTQSITKKGDKQMSRKNLKVATYISVASAEQAKLGYSLELQIFLCFFI